MPVTRKNGDPLLFTEKSVIAGKDSYEPGDWKERSEIVHDEHTIKGFFGEFYWLSNFGKATVVLDGVEYDSVERAYQAAKWPPEQREYFVTCTNLEAIAYNRECRPTGYSPEGWDTIKADVMAGLLVQKFDPKRNRENYTRLLATGDKYLEETNWWGDTFWGKTLDGEGENILGLLLMEIREELKLSYNTSNGD